MHVLPPTMMAVIDRSLLTYTVLVCVYCLQTTSPEVSYVPEFDTAITATAVESVSIGHH